MRRQSLVGPSFAELRRIKSQAQQESDGFPVFRQLADILAGLPVEDELSPGTMFDRESVSRYVSAVLSTWAYADLDDVAMIMARLGLEKCRCRSIEISNNGALIRTTAYLVQSECGRVAFLVYRGTDPFDISTWAVSGDLNPATVRIVATERAAKPESRETRTKQRAPGFKRLVRDVKALAERGRDTEAALEAGVKDYARASAQLARTRLTDRLASDAKRALIAVRTTAETGTGLLGIGADVVRGLAGAIVGQTSAADAEAAGATVHAGFYRNQRATWFEIAESLDRAVTPRESDTGQPLAHLYVTGHSLGAAMALLAGYRIARESAYTRIADVLRHVHAFAPPMVGNRAFAVAFNERLRDRVSCYAFKNDVVPHLPPMLTGSLDFVHVGRFYTVPASQADKPDNECSWELAESAPTRAESAGQLLLAFDASFGDQVSLSSALVSVLRRPALERLTSGFLGSFIENRKYAIYDHFPTHYEACSQLPNRSHRTEFGNDY